MRAGIFVREEHKPAVDACPDLELKAVYSRSKASVEMLLAGASPSNHPSHFIPFHHPEPGRQDST